GAAFLGDRARGAATRLVLPNGAVEGLSRVYLHAAWVRLSDSTGGGHRHFSSPIPDELCSLYAKLGGPASAWERALDDSLLATEYRARGVRAPLLVVLACLGPGVSFVACSAGR